MKDNLSIVILMIIFVMLIVFFPLYNYFERQDAMSYNLVLRETTTFVDKVLSNGYISNDTYQEFLDSLANTGNLYDVQLEAHKRIITSDTQNNAKGYKDYIEQYEIDYNDDIFQDTFFKVIHTINSGSYKDENKFINWVMRIAHNLIVDHYRRLSKMPMISSRDGETDIIDNLRVPDDNAEKRMIRIQTQRDIRKLIKKLPEEQRRVVIMRHYGKYDFKDIAAKTGVSINTALGRMRYAIINLRRLAKESNISVDL